MPEGIGEGRKEGNRSIKTNFVFMDGQALTLLVSQRERKDGVGMGWGCRQFDLAINRQIGCLKG